MSPSLEKLLITKLSPKRVQEDLIFIYQFLGKGSLGDKMKNIKIIYLAGGCFWGTEGYFKRIKGIKNTMVGYANGISDETNYESVARTDHAETVKIYYDFSRIPLQRSSSTTLGLLISSLLIGKATTLEDNIGQEYIGKKETRSQKKSSGTS